MLNYVLEKLDKTRLTPIKSHGYTKHPQARVLFVCSKMGAGLFVILWEIICEGHTQKSPGVHPKERRGMQTTGHYGNTTAR